MRASDGTAWPNSRLIGASDARARLDTPALLLDVDLMQRNIDRMARIAADGGVALRPHAKAHKSVEIAWRQIAAGAIGVSCATLGEAETMISAGVTGVLLTTPIVAAGKIARLVTLAARTPPGALLSVVDHPDMVAQLNEAAGHLNNPLSLLVDHAAGYGRTGVANADDAIALATQIRASPNLVLAGLQSYAGHIQHIADWRDRAAAATALHSELADLLERARALGIDFPIVTGGGTGTHAIDANSNVFTEIQPGSYLFMDAEYATVGTEHDSLPFETSLFVQTSVVSVNAPGWVTLDGGGKCFATDGGLPEVVHSAATGARYAFFGDEHGKLTCSDARPALGARVEFITPHCDPTVNLHDVYHIVRGDMLVDIWPIDARGER